MKDLSPRESHFMVGNVAENETTRCGATRDKPDSGFPLRPGPAARAALRDETLLSRFATIDAAVEETVAALLPSWLVATAAMDLAPAAYAPARRQFAADVLLETMPAMPRGTAFIRVTAADIFLERRPFVFGASLPPRGVAVVSAARLGGDPARIEKVIRHELGHLAGLFECDAVCLMTPAASCRELDLRPASLCDRCAAHLSALPR
jgi:predicted Zn-dependent protease